MTFLNEMYGIFPRQIGTPRRYPINAMNEFITFVDKWAGKVRLFPTVYNYTANEDVDNKNLKVDKIFFDFDSKKCFDNIKAFHNWLMVKDLKHVVLFSGAGFHVYVFTKNYKNLKNKKDALYNAQHYFAKELGFSVGDSKEADIDEHIVGDVARIATLLGTWNVKRKRFCVCVTDTVINNLSYDDIRESAKKQFLNYKIYGDELFDISKFDTDRPYHIEQFISNPKIKLQIDNDKFLASLPPCVANMLMMKHLGYKRRGYVIMYLRDSGYYLNETIQILQKYLQPAEFIHCATRRMAPGHKVTGEEQPQYFYKPYVKGKHNFPNCDKLKKWGECPIDGRCDKADKLYKEG